jgi:hypothetical protein
LNKIICKILAASTSDVHRLKKIRLKNVLAKDDIVGDTLTINLKDDWGDLSWATVSDYHPGAWLVPPLLRYRKNISKMVRQMSISLTHTSSISARASGVRSVSSPGA